MELPTRGTQGSRGQLLASLAASPHQSRSDLAARLGLGPATVSTQIRRLIEMGVVREGPAQIIGTGRPRVPLTVVPEAGKVIGVGVDRDQATIAVVGLDGLPLNVVTREIPSSEPLLFTTELARNVAALIAEDPDGSWWGLSVAISGVIDPTGHKVAISVVHGWRNVDLGGHLEEALNLPTQLANDIGALAYRELFRTGADNPSDFLLLSIGFGVGMALVRDHQVLGGQSGASTEIGHVSVDPLGPACLCGNTGCLQVLVGLSELQQALERTSPRALGSPVEMAAFAGSTPRAAAVLDRAGYWLGRAVGGACTMTGVSTVMLTGQSLPLWPALQSSFEAGLQETSPTLTTAPSVEIRGWDPSAEALGAAALFLHQKVSG